MSSATRNTVFICYAHRDRRFLEELHEHLAPLRRTYAIEVWDDTRLKGGEEWREEIKKALASATVAICLVSSSFRASKFIAENELPPLLTAAKAAGVTILPVIVGYCDFTASELAGVQAENEPSRPLDGMRRYQRHAVWVKVVRRVVELMEHQAETPGSTLFEKPPEPSEPLTMLRYVSDLNDEGLYPDAIELVQYLIPMRVEDYHAWVEYAYALTKMEREKSALMVFTKAYNLYLKYQYPEKQEITFPARHRVSVFAGWGSGTYNHGLKAQPDIIYSLCPTADMQPTFDTVTSSTVHVTDMRRERWVAVAVKFDGSVRSARRSH